MALCPGGLPTVGAQNWRSAFLPGAFQGTHIDTQHAEPEKLVENIRSTFVRPGHQREQLDLLQRINRLHMADRPGDGPLEARIESFELAYRMQSEAMEAFDVGREPESMRKLYGETT